MWRQRRGNKYHAVSVMYNGRQYHSKKEAAYAAELDLRLKAGDINAWFPQYKVELIVNKYHICDYYVDFQVFHKNGQVELVEVKGFETEVWRLKRKLLEATVIAKAKGKIEYTVVK